MQLRAISLTFLLTAAPLMATSDTVPDFHGMTEAEAAAKAHEAGFAPTIEALASTERMGRVFSQVPGAGSDLVGDEIVLRVSAGLVIPALAGRSLEDATSELEDLGIGWSVSRQPESGLAPGLVARSEPGAGVTVDASEEVVFLTISTTEMVAVPNLAGTRLGRARESLEALGLRPVDRAGRETTAGDDPTTARHWSCVNSSKIHTVTATDPPTATDLPKGSSVTVHFNTVVTYTVEICTEGGTKW